jgi:hypothetical protein
MYVLKICSEFWGEILGTEKTRSVPRTRLKRSQQNSRVIESGNCCRALAEVRKTGTGNT